MLFGEKADANRNNGLESPVIDVEEMMKGYLVGFYKMDKVDDVIDCLKGS